MCSGAEAVLAGRESIVGRAIVRIPPQALSMNLATHSVPLPVHLCRVIRCATSSRAHVRLQPGGDKPLTFPFHGVPGTCAQVMFEILRCNFPFHYSIFLTKDAIGTLLVIVKFAAPTLFTSRCIPARHQKETNL